jgi:hypothetical protein
MRLCEKEYQLILMGSRVTAFEIVMEIALEFDPDNDFDWMIGF